MSNVCACCNANHKKLNIKSCNYDTCRGEEFWNLHFEDWSVLIICSRDDILWDWGICLYDYKADIYAEYCLILTTDGEEIIRWSRKYDTNFTNLFKGYNRRTYYKSDQSGNKITNRHYYTPLVRKIPLMYDSHFYMVKRDENISKIYSHEGIGMYALVIIQRFWKKTITAKRYNKYRNYICKILEHDVTKNINCLKYMVTFL